MNPFSYIYRWFKSPRNAPPSNRKRTVSSNPKPLKVVPVNGRIPFSRLTPGEVYPLNDVSIDPPELKRRVLSACYYYPDREFKWITLEDGTLAVVRTI